MNAIPQIAGATALAAAARPFAVLQRGRTFPTGFERLGEEQALLGTSAADLSSIVAEMPWMAGVVDQIQQDAQLRDRLNLPGFTFRPIVMTGLRPDVRHELLLRALCAAAGVRSCEQRFADIGRKNEPTVAVKAAIDSGSINPIVLVRDPAACPTSQDQFLGAAVDASAVSWLLVVERATDLPAAVLDLCRVVDVRERSGQDEVLRNVLANAAVADAAREIGVEPSSLPGERLKSYLTSFPSAGLIEMRRRAVDALASTVDWENGDFHGSAGSKQSIPYVTICQEISGVGAKGEEFVLTYDRVTRPLPLSGGTITPDQFEATLGEEFPWMREGVNKIANDLRLVHTGTMARFQFRPIMFHGAAGIGKSRFARRMADLAQVGYRYVSAGGMAGGSEFAGTGRSAEDPHPSTPVLAAYRSGTANPIIFIDEIDKIEHGKMGGTLEDALLALLEPETAKRYFDECLQAQVDLSYVSYIFAVNDVHRVNPILLDRLRIIPVGKPSPEAFTVILRGVLDEVSRDYAIPRDQLPSVADFPDASLEFRAQSSIRTVKKLVLDRIPHLVSAERRRRVEAANRALGEGVGEDA
jgi:ATPase family associated with various cellular activities (AAA)